MSNFNSIETMFEIDVTPEKLFDIANQLEHHSKNLFPGQIVRIKYDSNFCFIYKPSLKKTVAITPPAAPLEDI